MNFLSVAFDDMNAYAFLKTLYGGALHTPNIDRVMAMGTTFENGFSQVAVCNASRTAVLTGLDPGVSGVHMNYDRWAELVDPGATLPALLRARSSTTRPLPTWCSTRSATSTSARPRAAMKAPPC
jgi:arylsulfatase A-like enzyme